MKRYPSYVVAAVLLTALVWVGCTTDPGPLAPSETQGLTAAAKPASAPPGLAVAMAAQDRHTARLMKIAGVVGTATGLGSSGNPAIVVLATEPGVRGIPASLEGVPVIVKATGEIRALKKPDKPGKPGGDEPPPPPVDPTARFDHPVPIGVSTGHPAITAGTIGCRVTDGFQVFALSNNHVYADENLGIPGDNVLQPGPFDGGINPDDAIGTLFDFQPIIFPTTAANTIDAAIALTSTSDLGNGTPSDGYGIPKSTPVEARIRLAVMKYGRTTGQTKGKVYLINATVDVGYDSGVARFVDQIIITPGTFSTGGDSGSLVVSADRKSTGRPVGLLFAGSSTITISNPIGPVLTRFGVTIDGE